MKGWWAMALALAMCGCLSSPGTTPQPSQGPAAAPLTSAPSSAAAITAETTTTASRAPQAPAQGPESVAMTLYLHAMPTGPPGPASGPPICSSVDAYMDTHDVGGDCDGHGRRPNPGGAVEDDACRDLCFAARDSPSPPYAKGSTVHLALFLTADSADVVDVSAELFAAGVSVGYGQVHAVPVVGTGGYTFTNVSVAFPLDDAVSAGADLTLRVAVTANESYFVGFEGDHASHLTLDPAEG